jgi:hypothetical protein
MKIWKLLIPVALLWSCSEHTELDPPNNPFDANNPDYSSPFMELVNGPGEGEVWPSSSVYFDWAWNASATEFRVALDDLGWTDWDTETNYTFHFLDEGTHSAQFQSRSINGAVQETPILRSFAVDAVVGNSYLIWPYRQSASPGDTVTFTIMAEEVEDLFALTVMLQPEPELAYIGLETADLVDAWGGNPLVIVDESPENPGASMTAVGAATMAWSGTISVLEISFKLQDSAPAGSEVHVLDFLDVRPVNSDLQAITVEEMRGGWLYVE